MKRISLQQIADELNISRITVSKVINNKDGVSEETRRRVAKKLVEHNYKKIDKSILDLAKETKHHGVANHNSISVIATEPEFSDFWLKIINGIANEVSKNGYNFVYNFLTKNQEDNFSLPQSISTNSVCGIIVINVYNDKAIQNISEAGIPAVFLDISPQKFLDGVNGDIVLLEGKNTIYQITDTIIRKGRRELGFIGDVTYSKTISDRFNGFKKACKNNNISLNLDYCLTNSYSGHFYYPNEVQRFVERLEKLPKAFICANDVIAYTLIAYLTQKGYKIPEDIAVSGYDNIPASIIMDSELTSVSVNTLDIGKRLAKQIIMKVKNPSSFYEIILIKPKIIYRKSTDF